MTVLGLGSSLLVIIIIIIIITDNVKCGSNVAMVALYRLPYF